MDVDEKGDRFRGFGCAPEQRGHVQHFRGNYEVYVAREDKERKIRLQLGRVEPWRRAHGVRHERVSLPRKCEGGHTIPTSRRGGGRPVVAL